MSARAAPALAAAIVLCAAPSQPARAGGEGRGEGERSAAKLRLGLDRLRAAGVEPAYANAVEARVCAALVERAKDADVVCPADVEAAAILQRNAVVFGACSSDDCMRQLDAVRAADLRVTGSVERRDGAIVLTLRLARPDAPTAEAAGRIPEDLDAVAARVPEIVKKLLP